MKSSSKHFVFVPGSFHGAWCWYKMQPMLNKDGNTSIAIDLPAHGLDNTPISEITLDSYVDVVCNAIQKYDTPVILIGHSRAGIIISAVAERIPDKIDKLVYLCAFLIPNGEPMIATAMSDTNSALVSNLILNEIEGWHLPKEQSYKEVFYHDCTEEDIWLCSSLLTKEPNLPVATPLQLSEEKFGCVNKIYIQTTEDRAITFQHQEMMVKRIPVNKVFKMASSHSPFLSKPIDLSNILLGIA